MCLLTESLKQCCSFLYKNYAFSQQKINRHWIELLRIIKTSVIRSRFLTSLSNFFSVIADHKVERTARRLLSLMETVCAVPHTETSMFDDRIWQCHKDLYSMHFMLTWCSHISFKYEWVVYAAFPFQGAVWGHGQVNWTICKFHNSNKMLSIKNHTYPIKLSENICCYSLTWSHMTSRIWWPSLAQMNVVVLLSRFIKCMNIFYLWYTTYTYKVVCHIKNVCLWLTSVHLLNMFPTTCLD